MRDENNNITGELVDVKVNKFEFHKIYLGGWV